jgi:hypothetical protein
MVDPTDRHPGVAVYLELYPSEQETCILPIGISTKSTNLGYCLAPVVAQMCIATAVERIMLRDETRRQT